MELYENTEQFRDAIAATAEYFILIRHTKIFIGRDYIMYLHEDLELFRDVISATSEDQGDKDFAIIEKDYDDLEVVC